MTPDLVGQEAALVLDRLTIEALHARVKKGVPKISWRGFIGLVRKDVKAGRVRIEKEGGVTWVVLLEKGAAELGAKKVEA